MGYEQRCPEGRTVEEGALKLFSRVFGWTGRFAAWRVRRILGPALANGTRTLDVGTGPGLIPLYLQHFCPGAHLIGLDVSLKMLDIASHHSKKRRVPLTLLAGDGEVLPFGTETLDVVTSFFALHHMDQPERFLKEMGRVIKPEGTLLVIDFRRDMPPGLFRIIDALWQIVLFCSAGRFGFRNSVRSAWRPDEIESILDRNNLSRFRVHASRMELWIIENKR